LLIGSAASVEAGGRFVQQQSRDRQRAPERAFSQSHIVEFELSYDFSVQGDTRRIDFTALVPKSIPGRQNILSVSYSPKPSRIFDENSNRYAKFTFAKPDRQEKVKISVRAELFRYDLLTARKNRWTDASEADEARDFLRDEKYIEKDHPRILQIADGIEGETEIDIVKNIYDYVLDNMDYSLLGRKDWGAVKAVQLGKGDCTEYSDLFVALCRAKKIPARVASGYTVGFSPKTTRHNWAEVYLQNYGWVPFDPSTGDVRNAIIRGKAFSNLPPVYIYLSHLRNDPVLGKYNFAAYTYWGDKIKFSDSIEFKHFAPLTSKSR